MDTLCLLFHSPIRVAGYASSTATTCVFWGTLIILLALASVGSCFTLHCKDMARLGFSSYYWAALLWHACVCL